LRGGAEQFIEETERSLHDAIMIVRRALKNDSIVAGKFILVKIYLNQ
jgi:T-complex protein 1 subunit eta